MHVQVLSASPAVKGIPAQHFPNLPRKRREWNDDYCMSCIFSSLLTNWKCSLNSVNAGISIRLRRFSSKRSIAAWVFLSSRVVGFACYMNSHFAVVADQNVEWYSHLHKYENHSPTTAPPRSMRNATPASDSGGQEEELWNAPIWESGTDGRRGGISTLPFSVFSFYMYLVFNISCLKSHPHIHSLLINSISVFFYI